MNKKKSNEEGVTKQKVQINYEHQLILFHPQMVEEEEKHNRILLWFAHKRFIITTLISLFLVVGSFFVLYSYKWIVASFADNGPENQMKAYSSAYIILRLDKKTFSLDLKKIGFDGKDTASIDKWELRAWFNQLRRQINIPPKNADQKRYGGKIQPERVGSVIDESQLSAWESHPETIINKPQQIKLVTKYPSVTSATLKQVDKKMISSYTTYFDQKNTIRTNNMRLAAKAIQNLILLPGEIFSFNKIVGERTLQKGYRAARTIVKGEYSEGIGGGICQISSTLFNSVDKAGLYIEKRFSFNSQVTYVPRGRDATVSWGGPDFRFKNNLAKPILIRSLFNEGKVTISIYSVPDVKVNPKKVPNAPTKVSQMIVKGNKPTEDAHGKS